MYIFRSKAGTFTIGSDPTVSGCYELCVGGMWLGTYETPDRAAQDVLMRCTGWHDWDNRKDTDCPGEIGEWEVI